MRGQKLEKLLGDHEARFIRWHIYAPLAVKLLNSIAGKVFISRKMCTISNHGLSAWIFAPAAFLIATSLLSGHLDSIVPLLPSSRLSCCARRLSHHAASLISHCTASLVASPIPSLRLDVASLPLLLCHCLSHCASSLIATLLSRRLLSCLTSHHLWCRYQCQIPPWHCKQRGQAACTCVECVPTCSLHCALAIHWGTSCPSRFCDLCLCTSGVDIM